MNSLLMAFFSLLIINILCRFALVPAIRRMEVSTPARAMTRAGFDAAVSAAGQMSLWLAIGVGVAPAIPAATWMMDGDLASIVKHIETIRHLRDVLNDIDSGMGWLAAGLLAGGLIFIQHRKARSRAAEAINLAFKSEFNRVMEDRSEWPELDASPEMAEIDADLITVAGQRAELSDLIAVKSAEDDGYDTSELEAEVKQFADIEDSLRAYRVQLDAFRRMRMAIILAPDEPIAPQSRGERVSTALFSRGMNNLATRMGRFAFALALILTAPAGLAMSVDIVGKELTLRETSLIRLVYERDAAAAEASWKAARDGKSKQESEAQDAPSSPQGVTQVAKAFERAIVQGSVHQPAAPVGDEVNRRLARERVLQIAANASGNTTKVEGAVLTKSGSAPEDTLIEMYRSVGDSKPSLPQGRLAEQDFANISRTQPGLWKRIEARVAAEAKTLAGEFARPISIRDAATALSSHLFETQAESITGVLDKTLGPMMDKAGGQALEEVLKQNPLYHAQSRRFLLALTNGSLEDASRAVRTGPALFADGDIRLVGPDEFLSRLDKRVRSADSVGLVRHERVPEQATRLLVELAKGPSGVPGRLSGESLASFEDFFPNSRGTYAETAMARLEEGLGGSGGGGGGGGGIGGGGGRKAEAAKAVTRARSYVALRSFHRVGGVLIGERPTKVEAGAVFDGLAWKMAGNGIVLSLRRGDGTVIELGPYRPGIVHLAMAYAADSRPVTVTMTSAPPLPDLKVLLHPALVDTAMGCRATEIDRFVDSFTANSKLRQRAAGLVGNHQALYTFAWGVQAQILGPELARNLKEKKDQDWLTQWVGSINGEMGRWRKAASAALVDAGTIGDVDMSPLKVKRAFFDPDIVSDLVACSAGVDALDQVESCLRKKAEAAKGQKRRLMSSIHQPPQFENWSGVREKPYVIDKALSFADPRAFKDDPLAPFQFMVQVAFTSAPVEGASADDAPWEYPAIKAHVNDSVLNALTLDTEARTILQDVREFALLQRLFRAAFEGNLGPDFPIGLLPQLASLTADAPVRSQTPRWTPRGQLLELFATLGISQDGKVMDLVKLRQLRDSLGVTADEELLRRTNGHCPSP